MQAGLEDICAGLRRRPRVEEKGGEGLGGKESEGRERKEGERERERERERAEGLRG